jgi:hypothetical protein
MGVPHALLPGERGEKSVGERCERPTCSPITSPTAAFVCSAGGGLSRKLPSSTMATSARSVRSLSQ